MKAKLLVLIGMFCGSIFLNAQDQEKNSPLMMIREVKNSLKKEHPDIDWDSSIEIESSIKELLLNKYKREIVTHLQTEE